MRLSNDQRHQAIGQLQAGITAAQVARNFGVHERTIRRLGQRYGETRAVRDRPRSGRPRETTRVQDRQIVLSHLRRRFTVPQDTARNTQGQTRPHVSARTIKRRLREVGIRARRPYCGARLRPIHRRNRLQWSRHHQRWPLHAWRQVLFTDECKFQIDFNDRRQYVYRRQGERFADACVKERDRFGGPSTMVWAGISYHGKTRPVFMDNQRGGITAQRYVDEVLQPVVVPYIRQNPGFTLQQDNARPHTARVTMNFLAQNNVDVLPWPSMSPDLNPIEHVWSYMKKKLDNNNFHNVQQLRDFLRREWAALPPRLLENLISSMRRRCVAVTNARGGHTRY